MSLLEELGGKGKVAKSTGLFFWRRIQRSKESFT
nr:MAG TPA: hypothetical protein [Caudoviricetes sp.]